MSPELSAAYAATTYRIYLPEGALNLRIGVPHAALARCLADGGHVGFAIVSACNPGSQRQSAAWNAEQQAQLGCDLLEAGYLHFAAENQPDGDWPVEAAFCIFDIEADEACALAETYGQLAFVWGEADALPHLRWTAQTD